MADISFELKPMYIGSKMGFHGTIDKFGDVEVHYTPRNAARDPRATTLLEGPHFPEVIFTGGGRNGKPSLDGGWLKVDGVAVKANLRVTGIRKGSRKLEMFYLDRKYIYTSTGPSKQSILRRDDVTICIAPGRDVAGTGLTRLAEVSGPADSTDLAIAITLEGVDTSVMTFGGALSNAAFNFFNSQNDGGGA